MKFALLGLMALAYLGHWPINVLFGIDPQVSFYISRGLMGVALFSLALNLSDLTSWRWVCWIGMVLEASTVIGGIGYHLDKRLPDMWQGLVDIQTGLPLYWVGVVALALVAGALEYESRNGKRS